jgi:hypothetical protein
MSEDEVAPGFNPIAVARHKEEWIAEEMRKRADQFTELMDMKVCPGSPALASPLPSCARSLSRSGVLRNLECEREEARP